MRQEALLAAAEPRVDHVSRDLFHEHVERRVSPRLRLKPEQMPVRGGEGIAPHDIPVEVAAQPARVPVAAPIPVPGRGDSVLAQQRHVWQCRGGAQWSAAVGAQAARRLDQVEHVKGIGHAVLSGDAQRECQGRLQVCQGVTVERAEVGHVPWMQEDGEFDVADARRAARERGGEERRLGHRHGRAVAKPRAGRGSRRGIVRKGTRRGSGWRGFAAAGTHGQPTRGNAHLQVQVEEVVFRRGGSVRRIVGAGHGQPARRRHERDVAALEQRRFGAEKVQPALRQTASAHFHDVVQVRKPLVRHTGRAHGQPKVLPGHDIVARQRHREQPVRLVERRLPSGDQHLSYRKTGVEAQHGLVGRLVGWAAEVQIHVQFQPLAGRDGDAAGDAFQIGPRFVAPALVNRRPLVALAPLGARFFRQRETHRESARDQTQASRERQAPPRRIGPAVRRRRHPEQANGDNDQREPLRQRRRVRQARDDVRGDAGDLPHRRDQLQKAKRRVEQRPTLDSERRQGDRSAEPVPARHRQSDRQRTPERQRRRRVDEGELGQRPRLQRQGRSTAVVANQPHRLRQHAVGRDHHPPDEHQSNASAGNQRKVRTRPTVERLGDPFAPMPRAGVAAQEDDPYEQDGQDNRADAMRQEPRRHGIRVVGGIVANRKVEERRHASANSRRGQQPQARASDERPRLGARHGQRSHLPTHKRVASRPSRPACTSPSWRCIWYTDRYRRIRKGQCS